MMYSLYIITNIATATFYVGITNDLSRRWRSHKRDCEKESLYSYDYPLYRAMRKHGLSNFTFDCIDTFNSSDEMKAAEVSTIATLESLGVRLYNQGKGGEGSWGYRWTPEQRAGLSFALTGKSKTLKPDYIPWNKGKRTERAPVAPKIKKPKADKMFGPPMPPVSFFRRKLNFSQAESIRAEFHSGTNKSVLSRKYGVDHKCIRRILEFKTYIS